MTRCARIAGMLTVLLPAPVVAAICAAAGAWAGTGTVPTDGEGAGAIALPAPPAGDTPFFSWGGYFQAIGFMCLLLGLLWLAIWAVRRSGRFNFLTVPGAFPRDGLRLEAQLPLGGKKNLVVVRFLNRRILLGVAEQQITLLKETELYDDVAETDDHERSCSASEQSGSSGDSGRIFARLLSGARAGEEGLEHGRNPGQKTSSGDGTAS